MDKTISVGNITADPKEEQIDKAIRVFQNKSIDIDNLGNMLDKFLDKDCEKERDIFRQFFAKEMITTQQAAVLSCYTKQSIFDLVKLGKLQPAFRSSTNMLLFFRSDIMLLKFANKIKNNRF